VESKFEKARNIKEIWREDKRVVEKVDGRKRIE
jgi:hypothetical protein